MRLELARVREAEQSARTLWQDMRTVLGTLQALCTATDEGLSPVLPAFARRVA